MNLPNKLTLARVILVPFLVLFLLTGFGGEANRYICILIFVAVFGRLLSGVHWFTDILGGILLSSALLILFAGFLDLAVKHRNE